MTITLTSIPAPRRLTARRIAIILTTTFVVIPLLACMIIGFGKAIADNGAAPTAKTADYNDGWVDMGQAMLDASNAPQGRARVDHCLATAPNGDALITCIDAIPLH